MEDVDCVSKVDLRQLVVLNRDSERVGKNESMMHLFLKLGITVRHPIKRTGQD